MKGPKTLTRQETHVFTSRGSDRTVADAAQLIGRLPNGWTLHSLAYEGGEGWRAVVISSTEVVPSTP